MKVMAFDLARSTGWAVGNPCGPVEYGTLNLDATWHGGRFNQLANFSMKMLKEYEVECVAIEDVYIDKKRATPKTLLPLFGYRASVLMAADRLNISVYFAGPGEVRKTFIGYGGDARKEAKAAVMDKCRWHGWLVANDDEADALALWSHRCSELSEDHLTKSMVRGRLGGKY